MNKFISAIILLALSSVSLNAFSAADKVEVCHKGQEINVAMSSLSAHKAHGDTVYDDEDYDCDGTSTKPDPKTKAAVVMMRCDAIEGNGVVVVSASSSVDLGADFVTILPIPLPNPPVEPYPNCAKALGALLNAGFVLRSINSGSAEDDDDNILKLYTDYLLIGRILVP